MKKIIYVVLGSITLVLGVMGIILPILPTTPFLLLSAFFYVRSSQKLYLWLLHHKIFGKYIYNYVTYKVVPLKAKVMALVLIWVTIPVCVLIIDILIVTILLPTIALIVSVFIATRKSLPSKERPQQLQQDQEPI